MHVLDGLYDIWELISMMRSSHMRELMVRVVLGSRLNDGAAESAENSSQERARMRKGTHDGTQAHIGARSHF